MFCGRIMWHFALLAVSCGLFSAVVCIQVHEDVLDDPSSTVGSPLMASSALTNSVGNSSDTTGSEAMRSALRNDDDAMRQNQGGNSTIRNQDNSPPNNSSRFTHHIHIPDTNSQPSIKQFVPSPQLNTWNEKVTLSPEHNHFQPVRQGSQYKVLHAKAQPVSFKHTQIFMPPTAEKGHFVWVPYGAETTTVRNTELRPALQNPWRWSAEPDNAVGDSGPNSFTLGDPYKVWQDTNRKPSKDWPYPFEISDNPFASGWTTEKAPDETTTLEIDHVHSKSKAHLPGGFLGKNKSDKSPWKKLAHILTAAIPIGLLISALTPHVVYVNPNNTYAPTPALGVYPGRLRSLDDVGGANPPGDAEQPRKMKNPLMDFISMFSEANNDVGVNCENRVFCELSRMGAYRDSDVLQKMLWRIANETPDTVAKKTGLIAIFRAIRENKCAIFHCNMHTSTLSLQNADNE